MLDADYELLGEPAGGPVAEDLGLAWGEASMFEG